MKGAGEVQEKTDKVYAAQGRPAKAKADVSKKLKSGDLSSAEANREHETLEVAEDVFLGDADETQMTSVHVVDALELIADRYGEEARKKELPDEPDIVVKALGEQWRSVSQIRSVLRRRRRRARRLKTPNQALLAKLFCGLGS